MTSFSAAEVAEATQSALTAMSIEARAIEQTKAANSTTIPAALEVLAQRSGKVVVTGLGKSGHICKKIAATLASVGTPAVFVHSTEALHGDSGALTPGDVMIAISNSGETQEACAFAYMATQRSIPVVSITADPDSTLAKLAQVHLTVSYETEADPINVAPTSSTTAALALGDALAVGLMHLINFTHADFHKFHPGGSLGAQLADGGEQ